MKPDHLVTVTVDGKAANPNTLAVTIIMPGAPAYSMANYVVVKAATEAAETSTAIVEAAAVTSSVTYHKV